MTVFVIDTFNDIIDCF